MDQAARFRTIFRSVHAQHPACLRDEWLTHACADARGRTVARPIVWSRRNGPWRQHDLIFVGAAPGNAGGKGAGHLGAHATRVPFGGDIAGANLDVLLGSVGISRNDTFITATLNQLPGAGGGEPTLAEVRAPVGDYPSSIHLLRDTVLACGPRLIVALGNVALRATAAALQLDPDGGVKLPTLARLERAGARRGTVMAWPPALPPHTTFLAEWQHDWERDLPAILLITHPSAQNMSPFARTETLFHQRMLEARTALQVAVRDVLGWQVPTSRPVAPEDGIYALADSRERIGPHHARLDALWRELGV